MPYSGPNDSNLPSNIKSMPAEKRKKWISIFNNSFSTCQRQGGRDCEGRAFRMANGSLKESFNISEKKKEDKWQSIVSDYNRADIQEATFSDPNGKREMIVTLLREGPGNKYHNNYYTKSALETAMNRLKDRPKQYFNHAKDLDNPDRDLRDWASSIVETWIEKEDGKGRLKAKVNVLDDWLWDRAKKAPDELAVSIEGKGSGRNEVIEGKPYNAIYEIESVNGVNWVDYPGNAGMGVQVLEDNKNVTNKEDIKMNVTEILEAMKEISSDELKSVIESRADLKEFFFFPKKDEESDKKLANLTETVKKIKADADAESKKLNEKLDSVVAENTALKNKVEAHELKEKELSKEKLIDKMIKDSKLKDDHVTETFRQTLKSVKEYKKGDETITEESQIKSLIEDREKVCIAEVANPDDGGGSKNNDISERDKVKKFSMSIFGENPFSDIEEKEKAAAGK